MQKKKYQRRDMLQKLSVVGGTLLVSGCGQENRESKQAPKDGTTSATENSTSIIEDLPDHLKESHFVVHNKNPLGLESRREIQTSSPITPLQKLFVRNNLPMPSEDIIENAKEWTLSIESKTIRLAELQTLPISHETMVLQCSGNGRGFFGHKASGSPWKTGAAGCVMWTGVRISDVIEYLGIDIQKQEANYLTATGGDPLPDGVDKNKVIVERSIPILKGLRDCLLAWEVNGMPIPLTHGGPLRLVVPGYFGCNQIKYVKSISFTKEQSQAKIQRTGYRFRPIGEKGSPDQPSMWRMPVKSWLFGPQTVSEKANVFFGVAFSGERGIREVLFSIDDGTTWNNAKLLSPDLGNNAWQSFCLRCELPIGKHRIFTKAMDREGDVQPEHRVENERGYGHNGWRDHALFVDVVDREELVESSKTSKEKPIVPVSDSTQTTKHISLSEAGTRGETLFRTGTQPNCGSCHTLEHAKTQGVVGPNLNQLQPTKEQIQKAVQHGVGAMPEFSGQLTEKQISDIATYIIETTQKP